MSIAKKIISCALSASLLVSSLMSLTGCHGARYRDAFAVPDTFDETKHYEITFWAKNDTNKTQTEIYESAIESFQELYPNITVTLRLYNDYGKIYNDVITNIATNTTPNVCITYPDHISTYMTGNNVVVPLDDLFADPAYGLGGSELRFDSPAFDEFVPQFIEECKLGNNYYAIPYMRSTEACYVNKTYVEALGYELPEVLTWDFVWEVSEAAMARNDDGTFAVNGQMTMIPFIYKSTDNMMIQMLRQQGAGYSDEGGNIEIFNDNTRDILRQIASHVETGAFSTFKISSYPGNFLNAGQCIFAVDSTAGATWMGSSAPHLDISADKLVDFELAVYPVPQYDPSNMQMISQGPSICIFNKADPQEVLASWLFAQYLLTNDVQIAYAQTEGYVPVTLKAQNDPSYIDYLSRAGEDEDLHYDIKIQASELLLNNAQNTFVTPVFNGSTSLRDASGQMIENTAKSVRRGGVVDDAYLDSLFEDVKSMYHLDEYGKKDLGPLPQTSVTLLTSLGITWVLIVAYVVYGAVKRKKE